MRWSILRNLMSNCRCGTIDVVELPPEKVDSVSDEEEFAFSVERSRKTNGCVEQHQGMHFRCCSEHIYIDDYFVNKV